MRRTAICSWLRKIVERLIPFIALYEPFRVFKYSSHEGRLGSTTIVGVGLLAGDDEATTRRSPASERCRPIARAVPPMESAAVTTIAIGTTQRREPVRVPSAQFCAGK